MKVGFIGAGNMASAMIGGIINSKLLSPSNIIASAKTDKTLDNIKEKYKKLGNVYLGLVHRLDRPVGGVMVFAKTSKAASRLSEEVRLKQFVEKSS